MKTSIENADSPCINICKVNQNGVCTGCFRTIEEIGKWSRINDKDKISIKKLLQKRKITATKLVS